MPDTPLQPPPARIAPMDELFHGEHVPDPYRWLEDGRSDDVRAWTAAQNAYTSAVLGSIPGRRRVHERLRELLETPAVGVPTVCGGRCFYQRREGTQNQPVLYVRPVDAGIEADRPLVDPNALRADGTVALDWYYPSHDGRLLAYGLSADGSELSVLHVLDVETGRELPDTIDRTRYTSLAWLPDGSGFYYTRLPAPGTVPDDEAQYHRAVCFHRLGTDPNADPLIRRERRDLREQPNVVLSFDGRWLVLLVGLGWDQSDVYLADLSLDGPPHFMPVAEDVPALFAGVEIHGDTLYLLTNLDATRLRVFAVPLATPQRDQWREIVPERPNVTIEGMKVAGGLLALNLLVDATSRLELRSLDGALLREAPLPALGTVNALTGEREGSMIFFDYTSFTIPTIVYRLDLPDGAPVAWASVAGPLPPEDVEVRQVWYDSTDGARVSMFVAHHRGLSLDGDRPVLLTGYGGFNISRTPSYRAGIAFWLEQGGVLALPNLRGGGEYGEAWHRDGMLDRKQHTFDDAIAAAEWLIAVGYTNPSLLAVLGGSNGGLLVGALITQRPELFRAAVCAVPLLDMLRYQRFLIARLWISEYGSAEDAEQYRWLRAYSPYHRVQPGTRYPAVLFTAAESDSRVDPLHARKMAALLQAAQGAPPTERPVLLRVETQAGHGQGKPIGKAVEEETDIWSFLCGQLGVVVV